MSYGRLLEYAARCEDDYRTTFLYPKLARQAAREREQTLARAHASLCPAPRRLSALFARLGGRMHRSGQPVAPGI
jgi:hypothetical protein